MPLEKMKVINLILKKCRKNSSNNGELNKQVILKSACGKLNCVARFLTSLCKLKHTQYGQFTLSHRGYTYNWMDLRIFCLQRRRFDPHFTGDRSYCNSFKIDSRGQSLTIRSASCFN